MNETGEEIDGAAERTENRLEEGADNVGDETREHSQKLKSEITDRELEDKVGPNGQEIYIDDNSKYYYIDESGNRMYVESQELRDKESD